MRTLTISAKMTNEMQDWLEKDDYSDGFVENYVLIDRKVFAESCRSQPSEKSFHH